MLLSKANYDRDLGKKAHAGLYKSYVGLISIQNTCNVKLALKYCISIIIIHFVSSYFCSWDNDGFIAIIGVVEGTIIIFIVIDVFTILVPIAKSMLG